MRPWLGYPGAPPQVKTTTVSEASKGRLLASSPTASNDRDSYLPCVSRICNMLHLYMALNSSFRLTRSKQAVEAHWSVYVDIQPRAFGPEEGQLSIRLCCAVPSRCAFIWWGVRWRAGDDSGAYLTLS